MTPASANHPGALSQVLDQMETIKLFAAAKKKKKILAEMLHVFSHLDEATDSIWGSVIVRKKSLFIKTSKRAVTNCCYNNTSFYNCFIVVIMYLPLVRSLFLYTALRYSLLSFHFYLQDSLEHFLQGRSNGNQLPQLCLSVNVLISLLFWKTILPNIGFLPSSFFF